MSGSLVEIWNSLPQSLQEFWKNEIAPKVAACMPTEKKIVVKRVHPTTKSAVQ